MSEASMRLTAKKKGGPENAHSDAYCWGQLQHATNLAKNAFGSDSASLAVYASLKRIPGQFHMRDPK
jgi:hypothetical protein